MFPDMEALAKACVVGPAERAMLSDPAAPIVLLARKPDGELSEQVSLDLFLFGAMLPSSPLHMLLLHELQAPLVMTSANFPGAPMMKDENWKAFQQLADAGLIHNHEIIHRADDSVLRVGNGEVLALRRGRGMAPYTLDLAGNCGRRLALGGEEKNTFALQKEERVTVSQHIGHLAACATSEFWQEEITAFCRLLQLTPDLALHDRHPDYYSSQMAPSFAPVVRGVPHHQAHVFSCIAEHRLSERALTLAWDGAGLGEDGTAWGGEAFVWDPAICDLQAMASWFPFPLIGGEKVAREPRRSALGLVSILFGSDIDPVFLKRFPKFEGKALQNVILNPQDFIQTSSVARLFDAVASLLDLRQVCSFEGQAALLLEGLADSTQKFAPFSIDIVAKEKA
jgi:hydrogenase maturation protein HypF